MNKMVTECHLAAPGLLAKKWLFALWGVIALYFCLILALSLSYHWGYLSTLTDVGTFDQAVWGTLHGRPFLNSNAFAQPINYFGIHFRPILAFFLPLYALLPRLEWLIVAQSAALAITAWPLYLVAREICKSEAVAFLWALVFLVNPFVLSVPPWVFRPESLAVPFIATALLGLIRADFRLTLLSSLVVLLCKEHFGITVAGLGILWWLRNRNWQEAMVLVGLGLLYSVLVLTVIMPIFSPIGKHVMLGSGMGQLSRYGWLGGSLAEIARNLFLHPLAVIGNIVEMGGARYLLFLLLIFCALPVAAPEMLLVGLADLLANILSANPMPRSVFAYHSVSLVPVLVVAAIYGSSRIAKWWRKDLLSVMAVAVGVMSLVSGYMLAPLPLPGARNFWAPVRLLSLPDPNLPIIMREVGAETSVSAQANVGAHFSQRQHIFQYPEKVGEVDVIVLRLASPTMNIEPSHVSSTGMLEAHLQMDRKAYLSSIEQLLAGHEYGVLYWKDPWLVFSRKVKTQDPVVQINKKLARLRVEWQGR
jgi:uncharacterized membrane protein